MAKFPGIKSVSNNSWDVDRTSSLASSNRYMLDTEDGCDVTLVVKGPSDKVEARILAHRYVLCSRSAEFYRLMWAGKASNEKKLKITDTTGETMRQIVRFLYCDEVDITVHNVVPVLRASRQYLVHSLVTRCLEFVVDNLSPSNVCSLLVECIESDESQLVESCSHFISHNTAAVLQSQSFIHSSIEVVRHIISLDAISVYEIDLFEACVAWAKIRGGPDPEQLRKHLTPVLDMIRFPTMLPEDFARRVVPLNILTDPEACNVYKYFTCPEKPPKRFITVKRKKPNSIQTPTVAREKDSCGLNGSMYPDIDLLRLSEASAPSVPEYHFTQPPPEYEMKTP